MKVSGVTLTQQGFDGLAAMGGQAILDNRQFARDITQQMLQKTNNVRAAERLLLDHRIQLACRRNGLMTNKCSHKGYFRMGV